MTELDVTPFRKSSVAYLHGLRKSINVEPIYQRQGAVWSRKAQQLLIDSIINDFDIPKIYFHEHPEWVEENGNRYRYSLVDGRQRLEAIWDFLDGKFSLADDFESLSDGSTAAAGKNYFELKTDHPDIAAEFTATSLDVMVIRTSDVELIEEMFSRLNEAVPLNAAEKRNGWGGPLRDASRQLIEKDFFKDRIPFSNSRYRHLDLAAKFLLWAEHGGPVDAKKTQLDAFWKDIKDKADGSQRAERSLATALNVVDAMSQTFTSGDRLLASIGMVSVYYLAFQDWVNSGKRIPRRSELEAFEALRRVKRPKDEEDLTPAQLQLLEFDRLSQSPNDGGALRFRLNVLERFLTNSQEFQPIPQEANA